MVLSAGENDERVAARVAAPEVVEINLIFAAQQAELVLVGLARQKLFAFISLKRGIFSMLALQFFLSDELDGSRESAVTPHVVAVRMRIDDHHHGFGSDRF